MNVALELSADIATKFYPKSKYPYLELSLDESLVLLKYVSDRFNELLEKPILKMFKGITLRRLFTLSEAKTKIDNNLLVKATNKLKVNEIIKQSMMVLNVVNPVYWFRRLVLNNVTHVIMIKLLGDIVSHNRPNLLLKPLYSNVKIFNLIKHWLFRRHYCYMVGLLNYC